MRMIGADAVPWWGVPTIAGLFLVLGSLLSVLSGYFSDRRKARLELERTKRAEELQRDKELSAAAAMLLVETREVFEAFKSNFGVDATC